MKIVEDYRLDELVEAEAWAVALEQAINDVGGDSKGNIMNLARQYYNEENVVGEVGDNIHVFQVVAPCDVEIGEIV